MDNTQRAKGQGAGLLWHVDKMTRQRSEKRVILNGKQEKRGKEDLKKQRLETAKEDIRHLRIQNWDERTKREEIFGEEI